MGTLCFHWDTFDSGTEVGEYACLLTFFSRRLAQIESICRRQKKKKKLNKKFKFGLGRIENIVGKGENAGYQHFLLFPQCFQKPSVSGPLEVGIVW